MVFHVPESKRSVDQNKFEFDVPAFPGETFQVPKVKYLPLGSMEVLQGTAGNVTLMDILDLFAKVDEAEVQSARDKLAEELPELDPDANPVEVTAHKRAQKELGIAQRKARTWLVEHKEEIRTRDAVRSLDTEQLQALTKGWQDDSKITLGES